nr:reverse transcriptase domain-containing protein [Tanacetum cinerariifolium]
MQKQLWSPSILADQFELKHSLINMMTTNQFFGLEKDNPHDHIRASRRWLEKEPPRSIHTWEDLVSKFINEFFSPSRTTNLRNEISDFQQRFDESFHKAWDRYKDLLRACPHHGFTELHQLDTFYNALNPADQDSLNAAAGGNLLKRRTQDVLTIIENKSKVRNSQNKSIVSQVKSCDANSNSSEISKLTHAVNQQTSACLAADGNTFPELQDNIQGYVSVATVNYNQGNSVYRPSEQSYQAPTQQNQIVPLNELEKVIRINEANMKAMQTQINMMKNELRNKMKNSIQASLSNQTNEIKNMMASLLQMNSASTSGSRSLPSNIVANPKGELKAITTRSGIALDGPTVPTPPIIINPKEDERVKETLTDPNVAEYTIKVPPPPVQKYKPLGHPKKVTQKLGDPGKFLIPCGFSELKCKALADLGASINLIQLSVWKKLGLPELISTCMTLELANRAICTPAEIARDVFVPVGKFTFPADFVIVDYESDPRVPFILGRPFLRVARALIDVHEGGNVLPEKLLDLDSTKDLHPPLHVNPVSGSTTYSSSNPLLEEFTDEHALDYSSPSIFDEYDDDFLEIESDTENVYDDHFDSKGEKIKESKLLIDELDLPYDFIPSEYDSFIS